MADGNQIGWLRTGLNQNEPLIEQPSEDALGLLRELVEYADDEYRKRSAATPTFKISNSHGIVHAAGGWVVLAWFSRLLGRDPSSPDTGDRQPMSEQRSKLDPENSKHVLKVIMSNKRASELMFPDERLREHAAEIFDIKLGRAQIEQRKPLDES